MRYSTSRQKVCSPCAAAKARCDRKPGRCSRCARRDLTCTYRHYQPDTFTLSSEAPLSNDTDSDPTTPAIMETEAFTTVAAMPDTPPSASYASGSYSMNPSLSNRPDSFAAPTAHHHPRIPPHSPSETLTGHPESSYSHALDFTNIEHDLTCHISVGDISSRWMNTFVPLPGQITKTYSPSIVSFIHRILKSYADRAVRGRAAPPFIHPTQMIQESQAASAAALATCLNVVRMCESSTPHTRPALSGIIRREVGALFAQYSAPTDADTTITMNDGLGGNRRYSDMDHLAAFQSALLYLLVLFFRLSPSDPALPQFMVSLQDLACASARRGLVCAAELSLNRPRWEAWIVAEAKRRTLYIMYLFDSALAAHYGQPTFLGTELRGLPAPSAGVLWRTTTRTEWERWYNLLLADWGGLNDGAGGVERVGTIVGMLRIEELWPVPEGIGEQEVEDRRARVARWLEDLDEFGTMMYAVTSCTHGG